MPPHCRELLAAIGARATHAELASRLAVQHRRHALQHRGVCSCPHASGYREVVACQHAARTRGA
jgi:hypothetical protein